MIFFTGTHHVSHAKNLKRCMLSVNILRGRKSDFVANDWIMDSGAFSELLLYGDYRFEVDEYAHQVNRWSRCGNFQIAVAQDYMCEPFILKRTGGSVRQHQEATIERYDDLIKLTNCPIMPVLQGYEPNEYLNHIFQYGERLKPKMWVGVGSICKRNASVAKIVEVLEVIKEARPDLHLHGFGLKRTSLESAYICSSLYSADSMAWSYAARRENRDANSVIEAKAFSQSIEQRAGTMPTKLPLTEIAARRI